jgi:hypothetical protein
MQRLSSIGGGVNLIAAASAPLFGREVLAARYVNRSRSEMLARLASRIVALRGGVNRNIALLALTSLCADISSEMMYPVLPCS